MIEEASQSRRVIFRADPYDNSIRIRSLGSVKKNGVCNFPVFVIYYLNQFWVAPPWIGPHSDSATLPPWWVDKKLGWKIQYSVRNRIEMTVFNVIVLLFSTGAAVISAICAYLARKPSRRDMVDTLKLEILRVVSTLEGQ